MQSFRDDFFALLRTVNKGDWQALFGTERSPRDQIFLARVQFSCRDGNMDSKKWSPSVEPTLPTVRQMCMFDDRTSDNLNHVR